ncbi:hypothetical protein LX16_0575 [Stackebrandtia albiflava]|uniref:DUF305 domain-containing protein n=1 Tax=Stackebrandtia albiflava TaxID=406432 RepID=A0A562VAI3_9ACTN|nr:hypothetical protein [Stackebrandtia albiflava]TWJ14882.1 hypothetical protein LX16_0575 [Stackebrandtia albiflava]
MPHSQLSGHTRRAVLWGAGIATLSGCGLVRTDSTPIIDNTGALLPVLRTAADQMAGLQAAIDAGAGHEATLEMLRDDHAAHAEALAKLVGTDPPAGDAVVGDPVVGTLIEQEQAGYDQALEACVAALPEYVVLLGEIAACRASHVDVLGEL